MACNCARRGATRYRVLRSDGRVVYTGHDEQRAKNIAARYDDATIEPVAAKTER